jgi:UDP-N-acetyl-D-mannosaminuronate dehydrogenase
MQSKTVCIMGLGYIGLPTAALLANRKYHVYGVDVVQSTVDIINQGKIHLVAHDEFKGIRIFGKEVFDFCGVTHMKDGEK